MSDITSYGMDGHPSLITGSKRPTSFEKYISNKDNCDPCDNKGSVAYRYDTTRVQNLFFTDFNIQALQKGIRVCILDATNGETDVGNQRQAELQSIMEYVYNEFSENRPFHVKEQVQTLNWHVLRIAVPQVYNNLVMHQLQKPVDEVPPTLDNPVMVNKGGAKSVEIDPSRYEMGAKFRRKSIKKQR